MSALLLTLGCRVDPGTGTVEPEVPPGPWEVRTLSEAAVGRITGNVGIAVVAGDAWVVWDEANPDQSDDWMSITRVSGDTVDPPRVLRIADTSGKPSIEAVGGQISVVGLTDRDPGGAPMLERQLELWLVDPESGGSTVHEVDPDNPDLSHGRADSAHHGDELHVCFVVNHPTALSDELWCKVRAADGSWTEPRSLSQQRENAEDHPFVLINDDGVRRVGATAQTDDGRSPAIALTDDRPLMILTDGVAHGEDVGLAERDGTLHTIWRELQLGAQRWSLVHQRCSEADPADCGVDAWEREVLAGPAMIDAPNLVFTPDGLLVFVWTEGDAVRVGWSCDDGLHVEVPDGGEGVESTERGQPSIAVDEENQLLHVGYRKEYPTGDAIRFASRSIPSCGAGTSR